jgi:hypothetical protein
VAAAEPTVQELAEKYYPKIAYAEIPEAPEDAHFFDKLRTEFKNEPISNERRAAVLVMMFRRVNQDLQQGKTRSFAVTDLLGFSGTKNPPGRIWNEELEQLFIQAYERDDYARGQLLQIARWIDTPAMRALIWRVLDGDDIKSRGYVLDLIQDSYSPVELWSEYVRKYKGKRDDANYAESLMNEIWNSRRIASVLVGDARQKERTNNDALPPKKDATSVKTSAVEKTPKAAPQSSQKTSTEATNTTNQTASQSEGGANYWIVAALATGAAAVAFAFAKRRK